MTYKAMVLQEDKENSIWFDCFIEDYHHEYSFDAINDHPRVSCKIQQQILNKDSISLATQDPFLLSVNETDLPVEGGLFDIVSYIKHVMSVTKHVKPRITKKNLSIKLTFKYV